VRAQALSLLIATGAVALGAAVVPGAAGATKARPNLTVAATAQVHGVAGGRVGGTFVMVNSGAASAPASSARLTVAVSARSRKTVRTFAIPKLKPGARRTVTVTRVALPSRLPQRTLTLRVCADARDVVRERREGDNCRTVGTTAVPKAPAPAPTGPPAAPAPTGPAPGPSAPVSPAPAGPPARPANTVPAHPVPYDTGDATHLPGTGSDYWVFVPGAYDATHQAPTQLFVWMHGCGGESSGDIYTISDPSQAYITLSLGGRDGACWDPGADQAKVLAAIADVEDHFNIDQRRIVIGGYSSGGDLAYRTAFYNAYTFAGVLAENTSPFRDTGSTQQQSLAAAAWRFHVVHLAHTEDTTYPIDGVRSEVGALQAAGFPTTLIERPGEHGDAQTDTDLQQLLLPHLGDGWTAP
jgi:CARDB